MTKKQILGMALALIITFAIGFDQGRKNQALSNKELNAIEYAQLNSIRLGRNCWAELKYVGAYEQMCGAGVQ